MPVAWPKTGVAIALRGNPRNQAPSIVDNPWISAPADFPGKTATTPANPIPNRDLETSHRENPFIHRVFPALNSDLNLIYRTAKAIRRKPCGVACGLLPPRRGQAVVRRAVHDRVAGGVDNLPHGSRWKSKKWSTSGDNVGRFSPVNINRSFLRLAALRVILNRFTPLRAPVSRSLGWQGNGEATGVVIGRSPIRSPHVSVRKVGRLWPRAK